MILNYYSIFNFFQNSKKPPGGQAGLRRETVMENCHLEIGRSTRPREIFLPFDHRNFTLFEETELLFASDENIPVLHAHRTPKEIPLIVKIMKFVFGCSIYNHPSTSAVPTDLFSQRENTKQKNNSNISHVILRYGESNPGLHGSQNESVM